MKTIVTLLFAVMAAIFFSLGALAQYPEWNDPTSLPKWMTPEEELRRDEIGRGFVPTQPPLGPVRNISEFDRQQGALIRYPLGIPLSLVKAMAEHAIVYTLVANQSTMNQAISAYNSAGVNMDNCEFILAATNSHWTRDYGPWFVANGNNVVGIIDFPYNRPRPLDNAIPGIMANYFGIARYGMNVVNAGGNYMSDGIGISASTDLVFEENGNNQAYVLQQMQNYCGINTYHVTIDPPGDYIKHIDCWAKFLDVDKILIAEVPASHPRYWAYEQVANYYAEQISSYGTPYQVIRIYTPNGQPYTNSLILNERVYVPITGSSWDNTALSTYQQAMPGYEVLGFTGSWQSTDALHCRVKDIADLGTLYVKHIPLHGLHEFQPGFEIQADIIPYSGAALYSDSLFVIYKINNGLFDTVPLFHFENHTYSGTIPMVPGDTLVTYYLSAADESGRKETWPLIGAPGARSFSVTIPPDVVVAPQELIFDDYMQGIEGLPFFINNEYTTNIVLDTIGMYGTGDINWYVEPSSISFPYILSPGETLEMMVYVDIPVPKDLPEYFVDSIIVQTNFFTHFVMVHLNADLLSGTSIPDFSNTAFEAWPNPFSQSVTFSLNLDEPKQVTIEIYGLQGNRIAVLMNEFKSAGKHQLRWDANAIGNLPEGVYMARITTGNEIITRKILFLNQ